MEISNRERESRDEGPGREWFNPPAESHAGLITLIEGSTFCVSGRSADIHPGGSQGLFFLDTRILSNLQLLVDGKPVEPLTVLVENPYSAIHVCRPQPPPGTGDVPVVVTRRRYLGHGMRDEVEIHNYGLETIELEVVLVAAVDFADLFAVKEGQPDPGRSHWVEADDGALRYGTRLEDPNRHVSMTFDPSPHHLDPGEAEWHVGLDAGATWTLCSEVALWLEDSPIELSHPCGLPVERAVPAARMALWRKAAPRVVTDFGPLAMAVRRAAEDLGALRIFDPDHPERVVVAAGAPWFMTLFGRDSLITAWMALLVDPSMAQGVLETLADLQGEDIDPVTEEQPGRILHEVRFGEAPSLSMRGGRTYYGSVDATPLFVMLLGELRRWGLADATMEALLPHADRALRWIEEHGDADDDGYVEYRRLNPRGLLHQGWRDSWDGIRFADGAMAETPIALCEVQGYVYSAYTTRARFAAEDGDHELEADYLARARRLKENFNRDFWLDEQGWYALALDAEKKPVDALASNMGHCLWTGIVDEEHAPLVARRLLSSEMFSGWGLRTLASSMKGYNPVSYHCGSVWPHDTAIAAAGLMRYGYVEEAQRLAVALLDLAATAEGRLPELIAGFSRGELGLPVSYPTSCSPQAWAAAVPLLLLRTLLRLDPAVSPGTLHLDPALPPDIHRLRIEGIPLGGGRIVIDVDEDDVEVEGLPDGIRWIRQPRSGESDEG